ncbi:unnamed protein product [marine sediment metagenome]|uniref:Homing endonuclease LAGLIDADG domain-containing protein n=1 Tax=marine sediment metagenome TaxID=412755 RepID=X1SAX0_9ZZZZ
MVNNDYIRGYFDAHGYIYSTKRPSGALRWRIIFQDQDRSQIGRAHTFLTDEGYHPGIYPRKDKGLLFGPRNVQKIIITRQAELKRFIKEIGTERPEMQERFSQFLIDKGVAVV